MAARTSSISPLVATALRSFSIWTPFIFYVRKSGRSIWGTSRVERRMGASAGHENGGPRRFPNGLLLDWRLRHRRANRHHETRGNSSGLHPEPGVRKRGKSASMWSRLPMSTILPFRASKPPITSDLSQRSVLSRLAFKRAFCP